MKTIRMYADAQKGTYEHVRPGARAIIIENGKILLAHERVSNYWCIPGGGQENGETLEETCIREVSEELGKRVDIIEEILVVESLWRDMWFENHFFRCRITGDTAQNLTEQEFVMELQPEWMSLEEANRIFSSAPDDVNDGKWAGCYMRDLRVLKEIQTKEESENGKENED